MILSVMMEVMREDFI